LHLSHAFLQFKKFEFILGGLKKIKEK